MFLNCIYCNCIDINNERVRCINLSAQYWHRSLETWPRWPSPKTLAKMCLISFVLTEYALLHLTSLKSIWLFTYLSLLTCAYVFMYYDKHRDENNMSTSRLRISASLCCPPTVFKQLILATSVHTPKKPIQVTSRIWA